MATVFILITVKAGTDREAMEKLAKYGDVKEMYEIYGAYDILAKVEADTPEKIRKIETETKSGNNVWSLQVVRITEEHKR